MNILYWSEKGLSEKEKANKLLSKFKHERGIMKSNETRELKDV